MSIQRVEAALEAIRAGKMVILVDDEDRENEGDLVLAAERVTPEAINFMALEGRGLICLTLTEERCRDLELPMMVGENTSPLGTAFTVSIEAATGVTTGISAADRSHTIQVAIDEQSGPRSLSKPGHVFPLRARRGGVLVRTGQTEGSVDLARLAGLNPSGVICEIMKEDGTMARRPDLEIFAQKHDLLILSVADLIDYRMERERLVKRVAEAETEVAGLGRFKVITYESEIDQEAHLAFVRGEWTEEDSVLTRVQSQDLLSDLLAAARQDGGRSHFERALARIASEGQGVVICLRNQPSGAPDLRARVDALSDPPTDRGQEAPRELRPDLREYGIGAQILRDLNVRKMRLMTSTPTKIVGLEGFGLTMVEHVRLAKEDGAAETDASVVVLDHKRS